MVIGGGPIGSPLPLLAESIAQSTDKVTLSLSAAIIPDKGLVIVERNLAEGQLIRSVSTIWMQIAQQLASDWSLAYRLKPEQWEELIAGAYKLEGFHEVIHTPRSGDYGRDIIATKHGVGCVRI